MCVWLHLGLNFFTNLSRGFYACATDPGQRGQTHPHLHDLAAASEASSMMDSRSSVDLKCRRMGLFAYFTLFVIASTASVAQGQQATLGAYLGCANLTRADLTAADMSNVMQAKTTAELPACAAWCRERRQSMLLIGGTLTCRCSINTPGTVRRTQACPCGLYAYRGVISCRPSQFLPKLFSPCASLFTECALACSCL